MSVRGMWWGLILGSTIVLSSCGRDSNLNQIFKIGGEDQRFDTLMALAKIHYDRGEHNKAAEYASEAYEINPSSEKAAVLYSYVLIGQVGIDPFAMTKALMEKSSTSTGTTAGTTKLADSSSSAADAMSQFSSLINIESADIKKMGTVEESDNPIFKDIPIFIPTKPDAEGGARLTNATVININRAIKVICPFVAPAARVEDYALHNCTSATGTMQHQAKSHFLWALAHLGEALAFNSALLYNGDASSTALTQAPKTSTPNTGLFARVEALNSTTFKVEELADYVGAVGELKDNVEAVFSTDDDSMLYSTLADLTAITLAFAQVPGVPVSVTAKISDGLKTVKELGDKLSSTADSALATRTEALKLQMNKSVNTKLKSSIEKFNTQYSDEALNEMTEAERTNIEEKRASLCSTYKDLSGYSAGDSSAELPTGCP